MVFRLMSDIRRAEGHIRLPEHMLDVSILETGAFDDLSRGMTTQLQHGTDRYHSIEVSTAHIEHTKDNKLKKGEVSESPR